MPDAKPCLNHCDHCAPDDWHGCVRPTGHRGYHSCQPEPGDTEMED